VVFEWLAKQSKIIKGVQMTIIKNLSEQDYNDIPALRSSIISIIDRKTLAHAKANIDNFNESDKGEFVIGSACHDAILRPEIFKKKWGVLPYGYDGRTKEGKAAKEELSKLYSWNILKQEEMLQILNISEGLNRHPSISKLLSSITDTEVSLVWNDQGLECKARLDAIAVVNGQTILIDLKTSRSAEQRDFERSCVSYGYIIQSAHYLAGAKACGIIKQDNNNFIHVVIEKEAPFLGAAYCLDDATLEIGEKRRQEAMKKYAIAKANDIWPGYSEQIETIAAPHWYFQDNGDFADGI